VGIVYVIDGFIFVKKFDVEIYSALKYILKIFIKLKDKRNPQNSKELQE